MGMLISCVIIMLAFIGAFDKIVVLSTVNAYLIFFEIFLCLIKCLIDAEMFDANSLLLIESLTQKVEEVKLLMSKSHSIERKSVMAFDIESMHHSGVFLIKE